MSQTKIFGLIQQYCMITLLCWVAVACSNEEIATQEEVQYVSELKVNFGKGDSRVSATHSDKGLKLEWTDGDAIGIVSLDGSEKYIYLYNEDSKSFKSKSTESSMKAGNTYFATRASRASLSG